MITDGGTISAVATPPGRGSVGIVRVSGPAATYIAEQIGGRVPPAREAILSDFSIRDENGTRYVVDRGLMLHFPGPNSFTGEDVTEFQCHGGPVVLDLLHAETVRLGARVARAGEFTERAFLNNKLDLAQAEAIADLIDSASAQAAKNAARSLQGEFSVRITALVESLIHLRMYIEAAIDFPEEEVDFLADTHIVDQTTSLIADLDRVLDSARQGALMREGMTLVLAGKPNAGKSSLMNSLAGRDTAIVTAIPGTTRDILREHIAIDGLPVHIIDTAGLRESPDEIEQEGIRRALDEIRNADRLLLVIDSTSTDTPDELISTYFRGLEDQLPAITIIHNKADLSGLEPGLSKNGETTICRISAKTGVGVDDLKTHLKSLVGYQNVNEGHFSARRRHIDALERARAEICLGLNQLRLDSAGELMAENLRIAQEALGEITGVFRSDDLLGRIFSSFCIGK